MTLKWKLILICITIVIILGIAYGIQHYADLQERAAIQDKQREIVETLEKADIEHNIEKDRLYRLLAEKEKHGSELVKKDAEKEKEMGSIVVPSDSTDMVNAFCKRGYRSVLLRQR